MPSQYLLRFDDICPAMNWRVWTEIEELLRKKDIQPILAVVPDNRDPKLAVDPPVPDFWTRVRGWQMRGWSIGLHGYQHAYVNDDPGILRLLTHQSEFAGLSRTEQERKLHAGLATFAREGVRADCWVAPSHSFDWTTVDLLAQMDVRIISDGLWPWPHTDHRGITWVPQQLWGSLRAMPSGVWTACYHHNNWDDERFARFQQDVETFRTQMTSLSDVANRFAARRMTLCDRLRADYRRVWDHWAHRLSTRLFRRVCP